jgi:hypothetical protein
VKRLHQAGLVFATGERLEMYLVNGRGVSGAEGADVYAHGCSSAVWKMLTRDEPYPGTPNPER